MKIAFLMTQSLESPSGLGRYGPLSRELVKLGHEVEIYALHPDWKNLERKNYVDQGVKINYISQMHVIKRSSEKKYFSPIKLLIVSIIAAIKFVIVLYRSDSDIVQLCKPHPMNIIGARISRKGRPIFCDCDDLEVASNRFSGCWQKKVISFFEDGIVNFVDGITVNTQFLYEKYRNLGFPGEKILIVPNGVERRRLTGLASPEYLRQRLGINESVRVIAYIGTLGLKSHPVDILIHAFSDVYHKFNDVVLLLVGGGEDYINLQKLSTELNINDRVIFTGHIDPNLAMAFYQIAIVTVDPVMNNDVALARSPLKIFESLSLGTPVVTSDVGDRLSTLINKDLCWMIPPGDRYALAATLIKILEKPIKRFDPSEFLHEWLWDKRVLKFVIQYQDYNH